MALAHEIDRAVAAHAEWKDRLADAIASGASELSVSHVAADNRCEFGLWLYALPDALRQTPEGTEVRKIHRQFHEEAGRILGLALSGLRSEATAAMGPMSRYGALSSQLVRSMGQWKATLPE